MEIAVLTVADARKVHQLHPVAASSEYTVPSSLPTNRVPANEVGWLYVAAAPGNPNAHFSLRFFTLSRSSPAARVDWKRVFCMFTPQPAHTGGRGGGSRSR